MAGYIPGDYYGAYPPPAPIGFEMHQQPQQVPPANPPYPSRNDIYPAPQQYGQQPAQQSYVTPYQASPHQPPAQDYSHEPRQDTGLPPVGFEAATRQREDNNRSRSTGANREDSRPRTDETTDGSTRSPYRVKEVCLLLS